MGVVAAAEIIVGGELAGGVQADLVEHAGEENDTANGGGAGAGEA